MSASAKLMSALAAGAVFALSVLIATPAHAAPATGCSGQATSYDKDGNVLDKVTAPGSGGTASDPFRIDADGTIKWNGTTDGVIQNGTYEIKVSGFTVADGKVGNAEGKKIWDGTEDVGKRLDKIPVAGWVAKSLKMSAVVKAEYTVTGQGGTCSGTLYLKIGGSPTFTPLWLASIVLFLASGAILFWPQARMRGGVS